MKIHPARAEFHADGRTVTQTVGQTWRSY